MPTYDELQIDIKPHGQKTQKVKCPVCSHQRKDRNDKSLSVNIEKGVYNCHYCGWKGCVYDKPDYIEKKQYAKPEPLVLPLSQRAIDWFKNERGIEPETLQYFKVSESREWMPEKNGHQAGQRNCINFNYYRDTEKVNVKYRDSLKCFRLTKDAELVLYNLNALKDRTDMLICEGEIDAMTFYQAGHYGAVSVPNGASKGSARLEYLDNCADVFEKMDKIIIATDGDEAGMFLKNELTRRLGKHRCWFIEYPEGCKDANEVQLKYGIDAVRKMWQNAACPPLEAILTANDLNEKILDIYENGWPDREPIGYEEFDNLINFEAGQLTTVTGIPGHGKDEFLTQILIRKAARYGAKAGVFNFEEPPYIQTIKLAQKYIGKPFRSRDDRMNVAQRDAALKFINEHFYFIDIAKADLTLHGILAKMRELVLRKGIKYVVIGPHNCLEHNRTQWQSETEYIGELLREIKLFALETNTHVFYVAHTTKMLKDKKTKKFEVPTLYSIAGSANFFNKTDNGICIYRNYEDNTTDVYVQKVKFFYNGKLGFTTFKFDVPTGRYQELGLDYEAEVQHRQPQAAELPLNDPPAPLKLNALPETVTADLSKWGEKVLEAAPF